MGYRLIHLDCCLGVLKSSTRSLQLFKVIELERLPIDQAAVIFFFIDPLTAKAMN